MAIATIYSAATASVAALDLNQDYRPFSPSGAADRNPYSLIDLDGLDPGDFSHCRWGVFQDSDTILPPEFNADLGYSSTTLSPPNKELFVSTSLSFLQEWNLLDFVDPTWDLANRRVSFHASSTGKTYNLLRRLHFQIRNALQNPVSLQDLPQGTEKIIILIHGWNPDGNSNQYAGSAFTALSTRIRNEISSTDWQLMHYRWEQDADTGTKLDTGHILPQFYVNPTEAAEAGYSHGFHLGELLEERFPNLKRVHLVAHSAGAWVARSACRYLLDQIGVDVQITFLDPYIPGATGQNTQLTKSMIQALTCVVNADRLFWLENIFAHDVDSSEKWFINSDTLYRATSQSFSWSFGDQRVDWTPGATYPGDPFLQRGFYDYHDGPIDYYADTVLEADPDSVAPAGLANPDFDLTRAGWRASMFMKEPRWVRPLLSSQSQTLSIGSPLNLTAIADTRAGAFSGPATWQWYKDRTVLAGQTESTLSISSVSSSSQGEYFVDVTYNGLTSRSSRANITIVAAGDTATVPNSPSQLSATAVSPSQVNISWSNVSGEDGYIVDRKTGNGTWSQRTARSANVTAFSDTGLAPSTTYSYRVRAYNSAGESANSPTATATTAPASGTNHALTIASLYPSSGVSVSSFVGTGSYQSGTTPMSRSFDHGTWVTVTCPSSLISGQVFQKWLLDGEDTVFSSGTPLALFVMNAPHTLTAVYGSSAPTPRVLDYLSVTGPSSVNEQSSAQYQARAKYEDGSTAYVTAVWHEDSSHATISDSGVLNASSVDSDEDVEIKATYTEGGVTRSDTKDVTIENINAAPTYSLILNAVNGHINASPDGPTYAAGTEVRLTAYPDDHYLRDRWSGDASGTDRTVYVTMDSNKSVTCHFILDTSKGGLYCHIEPPEAVAGGAGWKVWGPDHYYANFKPSDTGYDSFDTGEHYIRFAEIDGWVAPEAITATVVGGETTHVTGTYVEIPGSLLVTITPAAVNAVGARWRLDGGAWLESGTAISNVLSGGHSIEYSLVAGWSTPASQQITVDRGGSTSRTGNYGPPAGFPIVTSVAPRTGSIEGGTTITIEGVNFQSGATVTFGGVTATSVTVESSTRLTVVTPPRASYGTVALVLTSAGQTVTQANGFSYLNPLGSNIELVGQIGGNVEAVAVVGSLCYYGEGTSLVISDVANSAAPIEQGRIALPTVVKGINVTGGIAYVAVGKYGLYAVDVSAPTAPTILGFFDTESAAQSVAIDGSLAYVADANAGMLILNVTNPATMFRVGSIDTAGYAKQIDVGTIGTDKYAFVAEMDMALRVIRVTIPSSPIEIASVTAQSAAGIMDVRIVGTTLYVSDWQAGVKIFNATDPANLVQIGSRGNVGPSFIDVVGSRLYTCGSKLRVADLSSMPIPTSLGYFDIEGSPYDLVVANNLAFAAMGGGGLHIVSVAVPASMSRRSTIQTLGNIEDIWVSGGVAFIGNNSGFHTLDVSNSARPVLLATLPGDRVTGITIANGKATLVNYGDEVVRIVSVATPSVPTLLGTYTNVEAWNVALMGTTPVLAAATRDAAHLPILDLLNLANPSTPQSTGSVVLDSTNGIANAVAVVGNWAYVGRQNTVMDVVSLANPSLPQKVGSVPIKNIIWDVAASEDGNYVYVGDGALGIQVVNVTSKTAPVLGQVIDPPQTVGSGVSTVHVAGNRLFVEEGGFIFVYDITTPANPQLLAYYDVPGSAEGIYTSGDMIFVADYHAGACILRLLDVDKPTVAITTPSTNTAFSTTSPLVTLGGTATDSQSVVRVTWKNDRGGGGVAQGTTAWSVADIQLAAGLNRVTVTAEDGNGNVAADVIEITATFPDLTPPLVVITAPKPDDQIVVESPASILSGSVVDDVGVAAVTWFSDIGGSGVATITGQTWSISGLTFTEGPNVIHITATDLAGNSGKDRVVVFYVPPDTQIPTASVEFPTIAETYSTSYGLLNLSGSASDNVALDRVEWSVDGGASGVASGGSPWSINGIPLKPGLNVIDVTAFDASGNPSTDTISVTYVAPPLHLEILLSGDGGHILELTGAFRDIYTMEVSTDQIHWRPASTVALPAEGQIIFDDLIEPGSGLSFFRAIKGGQLPALPILEAVVHDGAIAGVKLIGPASQSFIVEASSNLVNWLPLRELIIPTDGMIVVEDPDIMVYPARYYRAKFLSSN